MGDIADWLIDSAMDQGEFFQGYGPRRWTTRPRERATDADFEDLQSAAPCQRVRSDGKACGLVAPCPDCGKTLLYWPAE